VSASSPHTADPLLEIENLKVVFRGDRGSATHAVDRLDLTIERGQTLGLVGESGCGKTVTALSVMGLLPKASADVSGRIRFDGVDLLTLSDREMRNLRGDRLAMIFQEPMTSLNPSYSIGEQIAESLIRHRGLSRAEARARTIELLRLVKIPSPEQRVDDYPHRLSGGMRQRAMIALALACDPELLIADEPTTALDVTIQAQVLELMRDLKASTGIAIILITHDLGVVAEICDHVAVMYAGEVVEYAPADILFAAPQHPYTIGLLGSIPRLDAKTEELAAIDGMVPSMSEFPGGCRFAPRCPFVRERCTQASPPLATVGLHHRSRCIRAPLEQVVA
jgi:peptide/nickel transport system ATP-binding protein